MISPVTVLTALIAAGAIATLTIMSPVTVLTAFIAAGTIGLTAVLKIEPPTVAVAAIMAVLVRARRRSHLV